MKKTLTVNLSGTVFHIDEDAYQLLDKYLYNLRIHFSKEEGAEEIMNDFEMRISELFSERIRLGYEVITIEHVEEVINRMGKPEDIFEGESEEGNTQKQTAQEQPTAGKKRLMRDPDNTVLGGVAAGIAAYMGWDVTAIRLAMILLLLIPHTSLILPIYIVLWLVVPMAKTAADRLMMRGESVTLETIGQTVTDGFVKVSGEIKDTLNSDKPRTALQKIADAVVSVFGFLLKIGAGIMGIILLPFLLLIVFVLFVVAIALLTGLAGMAGGFSGILYNFSPFAADFYSGIPTYMSVIGCVSIILMIGIPAVALLYAICGQLFKLKPLVSSAKWTLLVLWLIAVGGSIVYFVNVGVPALSTYIYESNW